MSNRLRLLPGVFLFAYARCLPDAHTVWDAMPAVTAHNAFSTRTSEAAEAASKPAAVRVGRGLCGVGGGRGVVGGWNSQVHIQ